MREILFRGKILKDVKGGWVYGSLITSSNFTSIWKDDIKDSVTVVSETVGQYTGLEDKHGVKIFEGDIVKIYDNSPVAALVRYKDGAFEILWSKNKGEGVDHIGLIYDNIQEFDFEVIGNRFDNPDLLQFEFDKNKKPNKIKIEIE